jgi:hypothetical protein
MSREQVHGVAGISARTRYQRSWPFAGSPDIQPLPHLCCREAVSRLVPVANAAWHRLCGLYSMTAGVEVAA